MTFFIQCIQWDKLLIVRLVLLKAVAVCDIGNLNFSLFGEHTGKLGISDIFTEQPLRVEVCLLGIALTFGFFVAEFETEYFLFTKLMSIMNLRERVQFFIYTHGK